MFVLFVVLNEIDYLEQILARFVDVGVQGATILDSKGMASALAAQSGRDQPVFPFLKKGVRPYSKTIFTVLENEELVERTAQAVKDVLEEIPRPGVGFMFSVPLGKVYTLRNDG
ncbi:MAG: hypothetical protein GX335_08345 [Firmicutes bacterium]|nr:hypothetical protein [Bacillota bacterium]